MPELSRVSRQPQSPSGQRAGRRRRKTPEEQYDDCVAMLAEWILEDVLAVAGASIDPACLIGDALEMLASDSPRFAGTPVGAQLSGRAAAPRVGPDGTGGA